MIISLFTSKKLFTISLPEKSSGKYWVSDSDATGHSRHVADVESILGSWILHSSHILALLDPDGQETSAITLGSGLQVIQAYYRETLEDAQFYIEPITEDRQHFKKYQVPDGCHLTIGRMADSQIAYRNQYVSAPHACLIWQNGLWSISDLNSNNGTFVNENRITAKQLLPGDMVCILGLKIIVGRGFFAVNNPDGLVTVNLQAAAPLPPQEIVPQTPGCMPPPEPPVFSPAPSLHRLAEHAEIRVDAPPTAQKLEETPLPLLLGPALTMAMTSVVMAVMAFSNYSTGAATLASIIPTLIMSFSMLCGTLLWPFLTRRHEKKVYIRSEERRQKQYEEYLGQVRGQIFQIGEEQRAILLDTYPTAVQCAQAVFEHSRRLWERGADSKDFLTLRVGSGVVPINVSIRFPEQRFEVENDSLQKMAYRFANEPRTIQHAPVTCSLIDHPIVGIAGTSYDSGSYLKSLILQLASLHSSEDIKLVFLAGDPPSDEWNTFRYLPHTWDDENLVRYWASSEADGKALSSVLEKIFAGRMGQQSGGDGSAMMPHYVLIASNLAYAKRMNAFRQSLITNRRCGISCIVLAADVASLPRECSIVVQLNGQTVSIFDRKRPECPDLTICRDDGDLCNIAQAAGELANLNPIHQKQINQLPSMITFLDLFRIGKVEHLNVLTRWRDNNPVISLQTPVGVTSDGSSFCLDLHEKHHGPHGLIAGMTGSGKSEFIITFILSMAVNYHPDEVSFILIDYKGGGLAGAFENPLTGVKLPHLAGTITNLDGAAVNRALISIQSELRRRQAVFNEARQISGEGTIDIYKYQQMYRNGLLNTPVPHLFIISDEFAELKAQQPEFMSQLISTARIGRSLGVHLILATQKPSGVVDDQIWSNSRFRVCLKVQERADSMEMLKRPDAAELSDTGRFYLQVGFNELFELGQSAWCGAPYFPADQVVQKQDDSVEVLDSLGRVIAETKQRAPEASGDGTSQIVSIVRYLSAIAAEEHLTAHRLWLPPIPQYIYLNDLKETYGWVADPLSLEPILGEYDDPYSQSKGLLTLPFSQRGNALLYGTAGSGKSIFLETLLCGLVQSYDAQHLNIYIVDLGEETLRAFEQAPQVGNVLLSSDGEKIQNLFKMLSKEIFARKKRFSQTDGDFLSYCKSTGEVVPYILVVLRNYSAFYEQFELLDTVLAQLTRDCAKYGIYFLVTANSANAVRYRIAQNFANVFSLQLNDPADYAGLFGRTDGVLPSNLKGRGIFKSDRVYEFQSAHFAQDASLSAVRALAARLDADSATRAPSVPYLPERVTVAHFPDSIIPTVFPVGVDKATLQNACIDLTQTAITLVSGQDTDELVSFAEGAAEQLCRLSGKVAVLDGTKRFTAPDDFSFDYICNGFPAHVRDLFQEIVRRNNCYKTAVQKGLAVPQFDPAFYVLNGVKDILATLDADCKDKLNNLLEHTEPTYGVHFFLCDTPRELQELAAEPWYKRHITGTDGIWVGDGISDQYAFRLRSVNSSLYAELPPHFGYIVRKGRPVLTKLLVPKEGEENS